MLVHTDPGMSKVNRQLQITFDQVPTGKPVILMYVRSHFQSVSLILYLLQKEAIGI